jgi:hypothetical protein
MEPCTGYRKSERGAAGPTSESKTVAKAKVSRILRPGSA